MPISALQSSKHYATDALRHAVAALQQAQIETASLDARLLLQHVLGVSREALLADAHVKLTPQQDAAYRELIEQRARRRPVAQLLGKREFWGRTFKVTGDTLDPRPDSETLIEAVIGWTAGQLDSWTVRSPTILDLGTGTGCLLLTLLAELPGATGIGVDRCEKALAVAKENAAALGLQERAAFVQSCWAESLDERFDIVMSNPPYIPTAAIERLAPEVRDWEPALALDGGADGLACYRAIIGQLPRLLQRHGLAVLEIGMGQEEDIEKIVARYALRVAGTKKDLSGITRCVLITTNE